MTLYEYLTTIPNPEEIEIHDDKIGTPIFFFCWEESLQKIMFDIAKMVSVIEIADNKVYIDFSDIITKNIDKIKEGNFITQYPFQDNFLEAVMGEVWVNTISQNEEFWKELFDCIK